jgi:hypothetical protein
MDGVDWLSCSGMSPRAPRPSTVVDEEYKSIRHPVICVLRETGGDMVLGLVAYVYASIETEAHEFSGGFAFVRFLGDSFTASAFVPTLAI